MGKALLDLDAPDWSMPVVVAWVAVLASLDLGPKREPKGFLGKIGEPSGTLGKIRGITPPPLRILLNYFGVPWGILKFPWYKQKKNKQIMLDCLGYLGYSGDSEFRMIVLPETVRLGEGKVKTRPLDIQKEKIYMYI